MGKGELKISNISFEIKKQAMETRFFFSNPEQSAKTNKQKKCSQQNSNHPLS